jgi:hypothetical protein
MNRIPRIGLEKRKKKIVKPKRTTIPKEESKNAATGLIG